MLSCRKTLSAATAVDSGARSVTCYVADYGLHSEDAVFSVAASLGMYLLRFKDQATPTPLQISVRSYWESFGASIFHRDPSPRNDSRLHCTGM